MIDLLGTLQVLSSHFFRDYEYLSRYFRLIYLLTFTGKGMKPVTSPPCSCRRPARETYMKCSGRVCTDRSLHLAGTSEITTVKTSQSDVTAREQTNNDFIYRSSAALTSDYQPLENCFNHQLGPCLMQNQSH